MKNGINFPKKGMNIALENKQKFQTIQENSASEILQKSSIDEEIKLNIPSCENEMVNASTTFINLNHDEPVGLDFNKFLNPDESLMDTGYSNDLSVITEVFIY